MQSQDVWSEFLEGANLRKKQEQAFRESVTEAQVALLIESLEQWPDRRALLKLGLTSDEMRQFWSNRGNAELAALAEVVKSYKTPARFTAAVMRIRFSEPINADALFNRIIRGNRVVQENYESVTSPNLDEIKNKLNTLLERYGAAEKENNLSEMKSIILHEIPRLQMEYTSETLRLGFPVEARKLPGLEGLFPGVQEGPEAATG
jgi:hypothetical protein